MRPPLIAGSAEKPTTLYHWYKALSPGQYSDILALSNFTGKGPARVGEFPGVSAYGAYDMAGNVKEWVLNPSGNGHYILGGDWNAPTYMFIEPDARRAISRHETFGVRCDA